MKKIISALFKMDDEVATGLSPTIRIWETAGDENTLVVDNADMQEIGNGVYEFEFEKYDSSVEYLFKAFGGSDLAISEQYKVFKNTDPIFESHSRDGGLFKESSKSIILEATRKKDINDKIKSIISNVNTKPKESASTKSKQELQEEYYANERLKFDKLFEETNALKKLNESRKKRRLISDLVSNTKKKDQ
jgi:hypothetical protein